MRRAIYACDVGSTRAGTLAWARVEPNGMAPVASASIDDLATRIVADAKCGLSIALGFESPLFMPVPIDSADLNRGRANEGNRSMFAPPAASVTTMGVHEAAWILSAIRDQAPGLLTYTLDWTAWPPEKDNRIRSSPVRRMAPIMRKTRQRLQPAFEIARTTSMVPTL